jgi:hypothetical protein
MAVSTTVYDVNGNPWTLNLRGNTTPSTLTLTQGGILIEYPKYEIEEPIICPKFTFTFVGTPATIEQFGVIQEFNQPFTLTFTRSGVKYEWRGYLIDDIFDIPNTGFEELISINGISELESLKYRSFAFTAGATLPSINVTVSNILQNVYNKGINYDYSFTPANLGFVSHINWYDEEGIPMNQLDVLKKVCQYYTLILRQDLDQALNFVSYTQLFKESANAVNYSTIKHKDIAETYSKTTNYLSASVTDSVLKPEDAIVSLSSSTVDERPYLHKIRVWYISTGLIPGINDKRKNHAWYNYETRLHVIQKDEYPGWTFPHYEYTNNAYKMVDEWWNPDKVIKTQYKIPVAGMYKVSYRGWQDTEAKSGSGISVGMAWKNEINAIPLSDLFLIKAFDRNDAAQTSKPQGLISEGTRPFAVFESEIEVGSDNYLLLSGDLGYSYRWGSAYAWNTLMPYNTKVNFESGPVDNDELTNFYENNITGTNGVYADIAVPSLNMIQSRMQPTGLKTILRAEITFKGKGWDGDEWITANPIIIIQCNPGAELEAATGSIKDVQPPVVTPLYEELGKGHAIRFGKKQDGSGEENIGRGVLKIRLFTDTYYGSPYNLLGAGLTLWLKNFNLNFVRAKDDVKVSKKPQSPVYEYGNKKEPKYSQINNYLMSYYDDDIKSFSHVYDDAEGNNKIDTKVYNLPTGVSTVFNVTEKPEEHTLRVIKQVLSGMVIINDVIDFNNFNDLKQVKYNGDLMVRDSYTIDALNNKVSVSWLIRKFNYN